MVNVIYIHTYFYFLWRAFCTENPRKIPLIEHLSNFYIVRIASTNIPSPIGQLPSPAPQVDAATTHHHALWLQPVAHTVILVFKFQIFWHLLRYFASSNIPCFYSCFLLPLLLPVAQIHAFVSNFILSMVTYAYILVTSVYACSIFVFRHSWPMTC